MQRIFSIVAMLLLVAMGPAKANQHTDFTFGVATSGYQIEGAWLEDKSLSVWDNFAHSGMIADNSTGDVAADSYHRYAEDIALMKEYGIKHYRTHIPWCRVVPRAIAGSPVNMKAVEHYRAELMAYKEAGITVYVNLFHENFPAFLSIYGEGKADDEFPKHFAYYADVCFKYFGDLVPYWFTFDEPYGEATDLIEAEGRETNTKPYRVAHQVILAHAAAVEIYRRDYQKKYGGQIGINMYTDAIWPKDSSNAKDVEAANRARTFIMHWFADPIVFGDYPELMKKKLGNRLPRFTEEQKKQLKGSLDFFAFNQYSGFLAGEGKAEESETFWDDVNVTTYTKPEWKRTDMGWPILPEGLHDTLVYVRDQWVKDSSMPIWVTENGVAVKELTRKEAINDTARIDFVHNYLKALDRARRVEGVNVVKYFMWSLIDNFEWESGFSRRFGLVRMETGPVPVRIPKDSIRWFEQLIKEH